MHRRSRHSAPVRRETPRAPAVGSGERDSDKKVMQHTKQIANASPADGGCSASAMTVDIAIACRMDLLVPAEAGFPVEGSEDQPLCLVKRSIGQAAAITDKDYGVGVLGFTECYAVPRPAEPTLDRAIRSSIGCDKGLLRKLRIRLSHPVLKLDGKHGPPRSSIRHPDNTFMIPRLRGISRTKPSDEPDHRDVRAAQSTSPVGRRAGCRAAFGWRAVGSLRLRGHLRRRPPVRCQAPAPSPGAAGSERRDQPPSRRIG